MEKHLLTTLLLIFSSFAFAQVDVDLEGISNPSLKRKIETNMANLFNNINQAFVNHSEMISYENVDISDDARIIINGLWETSPFKLNDLEIYENIMRKISTNPEEAYEVRNIHLYFSEASGDDKNQQGVLTLSKTGKITNLTIAVDYKLYSDVMKEGKKVGDLRKRKIILDFVENFRTAYNRKDIDFLNKVFSDDALIITGHRVKKTDGSGYISTYTTQTKQQYLGRLKKVFQRNEYLNIRFDNIKIARHSKYKNLYGVTVFQTWNAPSYSDKGYVFLLVDLRDENHPIIHVRTFDYKDKFNLNSIPIENYK